jgi:acyl carrier protein
MTGPMTGPTVRQRIATLVEAASDGMITATEVMATGRSLGALGLTSLGYLRLADAVELEFGVELDLAAAVAVDTLDGIVAQIDTPDHR